METIRSFLKNNKLIQLLIVLLFSACEKVVIIDVNDANQQIVVQGNVSNDTGAYTVNLNYSTAYYNSNVFPPIAGAHVKINDDNGNSETLVETAQGVYQTSTLQGTPGRRYTLQISTKGTLYTAVSTMPLPVPFYSVSFSLNKNSTDTTYRVYCNFKDSLGLGNYYRIFVHSMNPAHNNQTAFRVISDRVIDGQKVRAGLVVPLLYPTDIVKLELQCIDKNTYDFYNTIAGAQGGSLDPLQFFASLPANPTNNISNKGLGYFSAYSVITTTMVVP
jgi:hypothetical protein